MKLSACHDFAGTALDICKRRKTRRHVFRSCWVVLASVLCATHTHLHTCTHAAKREAGACGFSPVTAACSRGGSASGAAPRSGEACLCWP